ncbi:MAG: amidohydrolase family protein [Nitrospiraceae bacterium]|nr:amidohydrolase family protein [Nitrospiraceae bacterium]
MNSSSGDRLEEMAENDLMAEAEGVGQPSRLTGREVIDLHVHALGVGDSGKGCWASQEFLSGPTFAAMLISFNMPTFEAGDERLKEALIDAVDTSEETDRSVLLAMDGVHKNGKFVDSESHLVVPNDYVIGMARQNGRVLLGASVHPYRLPGQMIAETERCIAEGAALFVWAPAGQQINPEDDRCIPFYVRLAREGVPLFCHAGTEFAVHPSDFRIARYNDPRKLTRALDIGVRVIIANCASPSAGAVMPSDAGYFEELIGMLRDADARRWDLFADISACCTPLRIRYLERIVQEIAEGRISPRRFLYGSDFPMPAVDINVFRDPLSPHEMMTHIRERGNPLDSHLRIVRQFGMHESVFTNACDVLRL